MFTQNRRGRTAVVLMGFGFGITTTTLAPHASGNPDALNLWPVSKTGNSWTLATTVTDTASNRKSSLDQVLTVTDVKSTSGGSDATIEYKMGGKVSQMEKFHITPSGMFKIGGGADGNGALTPSMPQMKFPVKVGTSWNWKGTIGTPQGTVPATAELSVPTVETLKVLGQTVKAYKYHLNLVVTAGGRNSAFVNDSWYAPNIGLVKQHLSFGTVTVDCSLIKFTASK